MKLTEVPEDLTLNAAVAMSAHGLSREPAGADGSESCLCGATPDDWDAHLAEVALAAVLPEARKAWFAELFGTPEEIARREADAARRTPDDTVRLCELAQPGEHERHARGKVAADLKRAAAGRRDYASRAPKDMAAVLEAEARVFDTASRVATQPSEVMWGLLPAALWTDADRPTERREPW